MVPLVNNTMDRAKHKLNLINQRLKHASNNMIQNRLNTLGNRKQKFSNLTFSFVKQEKYELTTKQQQLENSVKKYIKDKYTHIENLTRANKYLDPQNILKRGFSITQKNGEVIKDSKELKENDVITTYFYKGSVGSKVINNRESESEED
jgi:exodeoxyribonuclease VII large subunit